MTHIAVYAARDRVARMLRAEGKRVSDGWTAGPWSGRYVGQPEIPGVGGYHLTATGDVGIGNPFLGGGGPRGIQLAAKFIF